VKVAHLFGDLTDRLHAGSVQIAVVLAGLDELMTLDVSFHVLARQNEVVVATVDLIRPPGPRRVCSQQLGHLQLRFDFDSTAVRRPFDCLSKVNKVTVT